MNPFPERWKPFGHHNPVGCTTLGDSEYIDLGNAPALPSAAEARGYVIIIAGKPRTGGKSVLSHRLLHEFMESNIHAIDLAEVGPTNEAPDGDRLWFEKAVSRANVLGNLFDDDAEERILNRKNRDDWQIMNLRLRRELGENSLAIRMPRLDGSLSSEVIARNVKHYARSAEFLQDSIYLYEYSYVDPRDFSDVIRWLRDFETGNFRIIEALPLLVEDAMKFVGRRLELHQPGPDAINLEDLRKFLEDKQGPGTRGLEISVGDFSDVMYRAFQRCELDKSERLVNRYIVEEYTKSVTYRDAALRRSQKAPDE